MSDIGNKEYKKRRLRENIISNDDDELYRYDPYDDSYEEDARRLYKRREYNKKRRNQIIIISLIATVAVILAYFIVTKFWKYSSYEISWQKEVKASSITGYERFSSGFIKYSNDGASYIDAKGNELWIESYGMKEPKISISGNYAAIVDLKGTDIYIFTKEGMTGRATTTLPITNVAISSSGTVAVVEEDSTAGYITFYSKEGTALDITIKTLMAGDGFPVDISLSPDGTQLITGYQYISGSQIKGRVVFYNFSEIGKNIPNRLVGGFDEPFDTNLIGRVHFVNETYSFAVSTSGICIFSSRNLTSPALVTEIKSDGDIKSIAYDKDRIGVIYKNNEGDNKYRMEIYKADGSKVFSEKFDEDYSKFEIDGDHIFLYDDNNCTIYNMSGTRKYSGMLGGDISSIRSVSSYGEFIVAGYDSIRCIKLR